MGTDIHLTVEYRKQRYSFEPLADHWTASRSLIYTDRSYNVFAILGNVRNGRGFAGIVTGSEFAFISDCRGLPDDITEFARKRLSGEHSATWVTLAELNAYNWDAPHITTGVVDAKQYEIFKADGMPDGWSGDVSGHMVRHVSNEAMENHIVRGDIEHVYTRIEWTRPVKDCVYNFHALYLPALRWLCYSQCNDNAVLVRLVMDFDS